MAFDPNTRNKLAGMIAQARQLLVKEFTEQLQQIYGIQPDGTIIRIEKLSHLDEQQTTTARLLRDRIDHLVSGIVGEKSPIVTVIERTIREQAFTVLNRFAALRMCEEREIIRECVRKGRQSQGFQVYLQVAGSCLGDTYQRYRVFLHCLFDELSIDLGMLFERYSPFGLLFPRELALNELLEVMNDPQLKDLWKEDETIGWVYQYFNTKEEREAMRKASQAPRNSRELAVRNQFFTPRYVVEFLTDNTLGRIWYEMTKGNTTLKEKCDYLVRRPTEIFLAEGESSPEPDIKDNTDKSQEELLKEPVCIPHRPIKDPRSITMIDPACGSMHFGLYAFDLYETIYEEAWDNYPELLADIREQVSSKDDFMKLVPEMIIRHNIHGIDIDPRACQIAELSLWLRAQKSYQRLKIKAPDRPRISKSNIVCAEPMPGEKEMLEEFISKLKPAVLGDLVSEVWNKMQLAGEAGSLLKIEEELKTAIERAKDEWKRFKAGDFDVDPVLFKELEQPVQGRMRFDVTGVKGKEFWDKAETLVLSALREFAESATNGHGYQRKLFAEDAVQGFAFIDLSRKKYDVVLMNPPYGEPISSLDGYLSANYEESGHDIIGNFLERARLIENRNSFTGAIISRTVLMNHRVANFRRSEFIQKQHLLYMADLGTGVLEAAVDVGAFVLSSNLNLHYPTKVLFIDALLQSPDTKANFLSDKLRSLRDNKIGENTYIKDITNFELIPGYVICYWAPVSILSLFKSFPPLDPNAGFVRKGLVTGDDMRFVRAFWEVQPSKVNINKTWALFHKGGDYSTYFSDVHLVVLWENNGKELKQMAKDKYGGESRTIKNEDFFGKKSLAWGISNSIGFGVKIIPDGVIYADIGPAFFPNNDNALSFLAYLNSLLVKIILRVFQVGTRTRYHWLANYVQHIPNIFEENNEILSDNANKIVTLFTNLSLIDEMNHLFRSPLSMQENMSLKDLRNIMEESINVQIEQIQQLQTQIDEKCNTLARIDATEISNLAEQFIQASEYPENNYKERANELLDEIGQTLISFCVGVIFGRWDSRIANDMSLAPKISEPFDPLPVCPPGMLIGPDGLPATPGNIVSEEWLRARPDVNSLPPEGSVKQPMVHDSEYAIKIAWEGILVEDPSNQNDIINHVREVFEVLWKDRADAIEQEACEILGIQSLRDSFRKPSGFFAEHLKRYSKSRRQAPIYWPLSTKSGSYTLWIYYHRLTDQTLYKCINDFVNPKIEEVTRGVEKLQAEMIKGATSKQRETLDEQMTLMQELKDLRDELLRVAQLPYKPNLNDGVLINASPLHNLFGLPKWKKDLAECWKKLEVGEYDWAHLAYTIWPERVREVCKKDRSIAIAHGLEDICEVKPLSGKSKKTDRKSESEETSKNIRKRAKNGADKTLEKMGLKLD